MLDYFPFNLFNYSLLHIVGFKQHNYDNVLKVTVHNVL